MPESFFILSKEYQQIAIDEIISIAKIFDRFSKTKIISNMVILQSKTNWEKIAQRASYVKVSGQILRKMSGLFIDEENYEVLKNAKTFVCRVINLSSNQFNVPELENSMGDMISKFSKSIVSLKDPDIIIYLIFTDQENFFGFSKRFEIKQRPKKLGKHPHELDWKLTRAMINLAGVKEGETVCDPFCGTGTTLLEASLMGINAIGIDFDNKMYMISKKNLEFCGFHPKIIKGDFSEMKNLENEFDAIITDLPYGRASKTSENPADLTRKFFAQIPKGKKIAVMCKKGLEKNLKIEQIKRYEIYRHKSLTRIILIK